MKGRVALGWVPAAMLAATVAGGGPASAAPRRIALDLSSLSDQQVTERRDFLEQRLDDEQLHAQLWQYGWTAFNAGTMIDSAVQAATDDRRVDRNTNIVRAVEGAYGVAAMFLRPLPARFGADPVHEMPDATPEERRAQLVAADDLLQRSADRAEEPYQVLPHIGVFGINLLAGIAVWQLADLPHAYRTVLPGILIGEAQLWTLPEGPSDDLKAYHDRFGGGANQASWWIAPRDGGLEVTFRF